MVRLRPGDRYTTAESDGSFSFHNLPLGEYEVSIDPSELPGEVVILSKRTVPVSLFDGSEAPPLSVFSSASGARRKVFATSRFPVAGQFLVYRGSEDSLRHPDSLRVLISTPQKQ